MTTNPTAAAFSTNDAHNGSFIVYINGIEVPVKSVSMRYGVWQMPEMQIEMVADPVLTRLGAEDRVQVTVFYLDDIKVAPSVAPAFRLFGEGEITGWGYRNTPSGRSIVFTCVTQFSIFDQLIVQFLTTLDDMIGYATFAGSGTLGQGVPTSEIVFPFSLFKQGLIPTQPAATNSTDATATGAAAQGIAQDASTITRPFDFLYNVVKNMMGAQVPPAQQTVPAANFFARWARLTNFHNRFMASPYFDEDVSNGNIFPVLRALQNTSAVDVIAKNLIPQVQNAGTLWSMLQLVYQTVLMEVAMVPGMPLVTVDLKSGLVEETRFEDHLLVPDGHGRFVPKTPPNPLKPNRIPSFFPKPQFLFGIPPTCNVIFPSEIKMYAYEENFRTQPTRLYFNDETLTKLFNIPKGGFGDSVQNALTTAYPPEADAAQKAAKQFPKFNGKNFLLFPEEFFKGPVMDRRDVPPWLFFLAQGEFASGKGPSGDGSTPDSDAPAQSTGASPTKRVPPTGAMPVGDTRVGTISPTGHRVFDRSVEVLRPLAVKYEAVTGIPADLQLAWVSKESGGNLSEVTKLNERGYFQIMGAHDDQPFKGSEADAIGLTEDQHLALSTDSEFSYRTGITLIQYYRKKADQLAATTGLSWSEGDRWRLTKLFHGGAGFAKDLMSKATQALGHPPHDWTEFYGAASAQATATESSVLQNATAVGGVVSGSSGATIDSAGNVSTAAAPTPAPTTPTDATSPAGAAALPASGASTPDGQALLQATAEGQQSVYQLYAEYEFFRERYAARTGTANIKWNPYVVAGFPGAIFDQRASRVDVFCYITTVQHQMAHGGARDTTLSFVYGRTMQEMFDLMKKDFATGAPALGAAPREPIRDIRKVVQDFSQAEALYQRLFYGARPLFGKDASFDWRKVVAYPPTTPGGAPQRIYVDGPSESGQDALSAAQTTIATLKPQRDVLAQQLAVEQSKKLLAEKALYSPKFQSLTGVSAIDQAAYDAANKVLNDSTILIERIQKQISDIDAKLDDATAVINTVSETPQTQVVHNLRGDLELVPAPGAEPMFRDYDAALKYNWRPLCTLDEYIIFYNSAGEGLIPANGHKRSVGAPYYDRIRHLTPLVTNDKGEAVPPLPTGLDGLNVPISATPAADAAAEGAPDPVSGQPSTPPASAASVPAVTKDFPQTRQDWDEVLLAYRKNTYDVLAPKV